MSNSPLPIIAVGALGLSSISCVVSSFTGFLVSGDSNVESNTSTSNTSTDTSNTSTDTSNTSTDTSNTSTSNTNTDTSNTSTSNTSTIPHQIPSGSDGWCWNDGQTVHQDVPGCGRICSSAINVGSKRDGTWGPWADNTTVSSTCVGAKLDEIWEVQSDGTRKLANGYIVSTFPIGSTVNCKKNDPRNNSNSAYRLISPNQINWYPNPTIATSWNPKYNEDVKMIEDCEGYTRGPDMKTK